MSNASDVVGPIPAHRRGFVEHVLPLEETNAKYRRYKELEDIVNKKDAELKVKKEEGQRLDSDCNDAHSQLSYWVSEKERLLSLPPHPERDRRILYTDRAIAGSRAELKTVEQQKAAQDARIERSVQDLWTARCDLGEYIKELCK